MSINDSFIPNDNDGTGTALPRRFVTLTEAGAITIADGEVFLDDNSAIAATLAAPPTNMDGARLRITAVQGAAHTVTQSTPGFNSVGSDSIATFTTEVAGTLELVAKEGVWYTINLASVSENVSVGSS